MANNKNKNNKQNKNNSNNKNSKALVKYVKNNVNKIQNHVPAPLVAKLIAFPFEQNYFGAKCPDESMIPTATMFTRDIVTFGGPATAGNLWGQAFFPQIYCHGINCNAGSPSTVGWTDGTSSTTYFGATIMTSAKYQSAAATFSLVRPVAGGIKIKNLNTVNNTTGIIHYCIVPTTADVSMRGDLPTTISNMTNQSTYGTVNASELIDNEYIIRHLPYDNRAYEFRAPSGSEVQQSTIKDRPYSGWGNIVLIFEGFPVGGSCVEIEHIVHYECIIANNTSGVVQSTDPTPFSPNLMAATTNFVSMLPTGYEDSELSGWNGKVSNAFDTAYKMAVGAAPYVKAGLSLLAAL